MAEETDAAGGVASVGDAKGVVRTHKQTVAKSSFGGIDSWKFWAAFAWVCLFIEASGTAYIGYVHLREPDGSNRPHIFPLRSQHPPRRFS